MNLTLRIPREFREQIEARAARYGLSLNAYTIACMRGAPPARSTLGMIVELHHAATDARDAMARVESALVRLTEALVSLEPRED